MKSHNKQLFAMFKELHLDIAGYSFNVSVADMFIFIQRLSEYGSVFYMLAIFFILLLPRFKESHLAPSQEVEHLAERIDSTETSEELRSLIKGRPVEGCPICPPKGAYWDIFSCLLFLGLDLVTICNLVRNERYLCAFCRNWEYWRSIRVLLRLGGFSGLLEEANESVNVGCTRRSIGWSEIPEAFQNS